MKGDFRFEKIKQDSDVVALLKLICNIAFDIEADRKSFVAQVNYINIKQRFNTTNDAYYDLFINNQEVLVHAEGDLGNNESLIIVIIKEIRLVLLTIGAT